MNIKSIFLSLFLFALFFSMGLFITTSLRHNAVTDKSITSFPVAQKTLPLPPPEQRRSCTLNDQIYPDGAIVGGLICRDGTWYPLPRR